MSDYQLLPDEVSKAYGTHIRYLLMECSDPSCLHTWGVNVYDNTLTREDLTCQKCATKQYLANKK